MNRTLKTLDAFIEYLSATEEDSWALGIVRNIGNTQNCLFGHLVNWFHGKEFAGNVMPIMDAFEAIWATTYMVYAVNDGEDPRYLQETPKQRVIAYLSDLNMGRAKTTQVLMDECEALEALA